MMLLLKNLVFTVIVPGTVAVYVPLLIVRHEPRTSGTVFILAIALLAFGGIIYAWCLWDFASFGRATPAPIDPPKKLVIRGLYRYTRNPMYLGVITVILGWALMHGSVTLVVYAICVGTCFHLFIVLYEERRLRQQFGNDYENYCARVSRWLPRLRRRPAT